MQLNPFTLHKPKTLPAAAALLTELPDLKILAGGTFLINHLRFLKKKGLKTPTHILSLRAIDELNGFSVAEGASIQIKSMTTFSDVIQSSLIQEKLPDFIGVCRQIGTTPIRNMGTIGGNLTCRYAWAELGTVLLALEAGMHFLDKSGHNQIVTVEDFFKTSAKTDKILTSISIARPETTVISYQRVKKTVHLDIPLLAVCLTAQKEGQRFKNIRATVNTGTTWPARDHKLEEFLNQTAWDSATSQNALTHLDTAIYDINADDYKKQIFRVAIRDSVEGLQRKLK